MSLSVVPSLWAWLFGAVRPAYRRAQAGPQELVIDCAEGRYTVAFAGVEEITLEKGLFWDRIRLRHASGKSTVLSGLSKRRADAFGARLESDRLACRQALDTLARLRPRIEAVHAAIAELTGGQVYAARHRIEAALEELASLGEALAVEDELLPDDAQLKKQLRELRTFRTRHDEICNQANIFQFLGCLKRGFSFYNGAAV